MALVRQRLRCRYSSATESLSGPRHLEMALGAEKARAARGSGAHSSPRPLQRIRHQRTAAFEPGGNRQALGLEELRVEKLRLISRSVVTEHRHNRPARAQLLGQPDGAGNVHPGGRAEAEPLLVEQTENRGYSLIIRNSEREIGCKAFQVGSYSPLADPLGD